MIGFVVYAFAHNIIFYLAAVILLLLVLLIVNIQPFKAPVAHYSKINATFFSLLIFMYIVVCGKSVASIKVQQFFHFFYICTFDFFCYHSSCLHIANVSLLDLLTQRIKIEACYYDQIQEKRLQLDK